MLFIWPELNLAKESPFGYRLHGVHKIKGKRPYLVLVSKEEIDALAGAKEGYKETYMDKMLKPSVRKDGKVIVY